VSSIHEAQILCRNSAAEVPRSLRGPKPARREDSHKFGHSDVPPKKSEFALAIDNGIIPI
jgi:hypothetical protein